MDYLLVMISIIVQVTLYLSILACVLYCKSRKSRRKKENQKAVPLRVWNVDRRQKTTVDEKVRVWMETAEFRADPLIDIELGFRDLVDDIDISVGADTTSRTNEQGEWGFSPRLPQIAADEGKEEKPNVTNIEYSTSTEISSNSVRSIVIKRISKEDSLLSGSHKSMALEESPKDNG